MQAWVTEELKTVDIGDHRLNERVAVLLDRMSTKPSLKFTGACKGSWAEIAAAYRFVKNRRVTPAKILAPHRAATLKRIREQDVVIIAQDTTEIDLTRKREHMAGAGPLGDGPREGFFVHPSLAVTLAGVTLGIVGVTIWARPRGVPSRRKAPRSRRAARPIEQKESFRWLEGYRLACRIAREAPKARVISVSDSEGDIYECYAEEAAQAAKGGSAHWIVRACRDRSLKAPVGDRGTPEGAAEAAMAHLWAAAAAAPVVGTKVIHVGAREARSGDGQRRKKARSARRAVVTVRATRAMLRGPCRRGGALPDLEVNAVLVREESPPPGEEPIEWLLLTDLSIDDLEAILHVISYYCRRWDVETCQADCTSSDAWCGAPGTGYDRRRRAA